MCLTVTSNGLEEECLEQPADSKPKKKQKKKTEAPSEGTTTEETPLKKTTKKKRKLAVTAESPGKMSFNLKLTSCFYM